ncbi:MAG: CBS domain-containing protein [Methanocellales archaeon]
MVIKGKVKDFMRVDIPSVQITSTLQDVINQMSRHRSGAVLVKEGDVVVGMVTEERYSQV